MNKETHFKDIYDEHNIKVRSMLYSITKSSDIDDLVQEVFIKIWNNLDKFRGESKISTWIYSITVRTAYDHFRKIKKDNKNTDEGLKQIGIPSNEKDIDNKALVRFGLDNLHKDQRVVVGLHYLEGFSLAEIAAIQEVSIGTVKSRLFYAKKKLLDLFSKHGVAL